MVPWGCLQFVIVVFPDHTHYFLYSGMAVSGQDKLEGFVGEIFPKIVTTESLGRERKLPTETGDATGIKDRHTAGIT